MIERMSNAITALLPVIAQGIGQTALVNSRELAELTAANDAYVRGVETPDFTDKAPATAGEARERAVAAMERFTG